MSGKRLNLGQTSFRRRMLLSGFSGSARPERTLPLDHRLRAIGEDVSAARIDELWVFPPLPNRDTACEFLVLICYDGEERRRVLTAHVDAERSDPESDEFEWVQRIQEHGPVPQGWVSAIPERMLQRLSEAGIPEIIEVGGRPEVWDKAIARFAEGNGSGGNGNGSAAVDRDQNGKLVLGVAQPSIVSETGV